MQGRKFMFKHGGDNNGVKYTFRLRDVSRGTKRRALLGGSGACPPRDFFKMVQFGAFCCIYLDQIVSLKIFF